MTTSERPSKLQTYFKLAVVWANQATCTRAQHGAVYVTEDGHVVSSGYNGSPRGMPQCDEVGCLLDVNHCVRSVHAEINGILQAARVGVSLKGTDVFITARPCIRCFIAMVQVGVRRIFYPITSSYTSDDERALMDLYYKTNLEMFIVDVEKNIPIKFSNYP